jgi:hypothetical protein
MGELLTGATFNQLFVTFERTARRLETRNHYDVPVEREPFQRFLAGLLDDPDYRVVREPWFAGVRAITAAGKRRQRVRVVPESLTDYLRWELRICRDNVAVGEDVRYLRRDQATISICPTTTSGSSTATVWRCCTSPPTTGSSARRCSPIPTSWPGTKDGSTSRSSTPCPTSSSSPRALVCPPPTLRAQLDHWIGLLVLSALDNVARLAQELVDTD